MAIKVLRQLVLLGVMILISFRAEAKIKVVVTLPDLAAISRAVGGEQVEVTCLALPTEDPHYVDPKPNFIVRLNRADALVEGGAELELGWLPALLQKTGNRKIAAGAPGNIRASAGIQLVQPAGPVDRSRGDIHAAGNPHFLTDPANARIVAAHLAEAFCEIDPKSAVAYRANLKQFTERLDAKLAEWEKKLAPYKGQHIAAYHDSWPYFGNRFGLNIDLFLEPKPGIPPSPAHLAAVQSAMRQEKVRVILLEPYLNRRTADAVARATGAKVLEVSQFPGGVKGTEKGYIELMDYIVNSMVQALGQRSGA